jgi:hypothetical protein
VIGIVTAMLSLLAAAGQASAATVFDDYGNLAGYELYQAGSTNVSSTFTVPTVSCPSLDPSGLAVGTFGMLSSRFGAQPYFYGAQLKFSCDNGVLTTTEGLLVSGQETTFTHPVNAGDKITTTLTVASTGSRVTISDITAPRAFTETAAGLETYANLEYFGGNALETYGDQFGQQTVTQLPVPQFSPISFTNVTAGGKPLASITPKTALSIDRGCLEDAQALAITNQKNFIVTSPPVNVTSFSPTVLPAGGTLEVDGRGFTSATKVTFINNQVAKVLDRSPSTLHVVVPMAAQSGPFTVANATGANIGSVTTRCSVNVTPTITKFTPTLGRTGISVTLNGGGFNQVQSVAFGAVPAVYTVSSPIAIKAIVPNGATTSAITVNTIWGTTTTASLFTVTLSITGFSPSSGHILSVVTINGVGFNKSSKVKFNGKAATTHLVSSTQLTATVPLGATSGSITVTNSTAPTGTVTSAGQFTVN